MPRGAARRRQAASPRIGFLQAPGITIAYAVASISVGAWLVSLRTPRETSDPLPCSPPLAARMRRAVDARSFEARVSALQKRAMALRPTVTSKRNFGYDSDSTGHRVTYLHVCDLGSELIMHARAPHGHA